MKIGILKKTTETERFVALMPQIAQLLSKQKVELIAESKRESVPDSKTLIMRSWFYHPKICHRGP